MACQVGLAVVCLLSVGLAAASAPPAPTCPYCTCEYNGPSFELHHLKDNPITKDLQCLDWCQKHHPIQLYDSDCEWDYKKGFCYTVCAGCAIPTGGCYQTKYSKCPSYTSAGECSSGDGGPKACSCALKNGFDSCKPCYQCQCKYTMGTLTLNVSNSHNVIATPEICSKRCKEHGLKADGWWGGCDGTVNPYGCNSTGCAEGCSYITDNCKPHNQYCYDPYPGETECRCPLTGSAVEPKCPTTTHPPVVPSAFAEAGEGELEGVELPTQRRLTTQSKGKMGAVNEEDICPGL